MTEEGKKGGRRGVESEGSNSELETRQSIVFIVTIT